MVGGAGVGMEMGQGPRGGRMRGTVLAGRRDPTRTGERGTG